jgi:hypothetical protein
VEEPPGTGPVSRERVMHLSRAWDAEAAQIERTLDDQAPGQRPYRATRARVRRECAEGLRALLDENTIEEREQEQS